MKFPYPESTLKKVFLMLGFACNFKCRHCIQGDSHIVQPGSCEPSQKVYQYLEHLIKIRPQTQEKLILMFWGGEPLLYFDTIKKVVSRFGDNLSYTLISNGSLLTSEIVDYINSNNITFVLSYDGVGTEKVRNINVLENPNILTLFKRINHKSIDAVISAYNYDFQELFNDIDTKLGSDIPVTIEPLRISWDIPSDLYTIDISEYTQKLHKLAIMAVTDIRAGNISRASEFFIPYLTKLYTEPKSLLNCQQTYYILNIDLAGNIHTCHNVNNVIGTVEDPRYKLIEQQDLYVRHKYAPACSTCDVFWLCNGGCPNELTTPDGNRVSCKFTKILANEVLWIANQLLATFTPVDLEV